MGIPTDITVYVKLGVRGLILLNSIWGLAAASYVSAWAVIELNLVLLLPLIILGSRNKRDITAVKYLLIQRVSGLLLLATIFISRGASRSRTVQLLPTLLIFYKLGAFPFFQWVFIVGNRLEWYVLYLILGLQKLVPLIFARHLWVLSGAVIIGVGWLFIPLATYHSISIKKVIILSSVFNLGALLVTIGYSRFKWKILLLIYLLIRAPIICLEGLLERHRRGLKARVPLFKGGMLGTILFSIAGLPPLAGFFFKVEVINVLWLRCSGTLMARFLVGSCGIVLVYVAILIKTALRSPSLVLRASRANGTLLIARGLIITRALVI